MTPLIVCVPNKSSNKPKPKFKFILERKQEGAMKRVFKSLCCFVHYLVQNYCIDVHNKLFIVIAWWCILDGLVQVQIREGSK